MDLKSEFPWIDSTFLTKIIQKELSFSVESVQIQSFEITNACGTGENFVSSLLRVRITFSVNQRDPQISSYIIKVMDEESRFKNFVSLHELFEREAFMYETILPKLDEISNENSREILDLAPR